MSRPKVVFIAGAAHGGTTILNMVLGQQQVYRGSVTLEIRYYQELIRRGVKTRSPDS